MRKRSRAREYALQLLYQLDVVRVKDRAAQDIIQEFWLYHQVPDEIRVFATTLVGGTWKEIEALDKLIAAHANNWDIARMAVVDRNILRLGSYELIHCEEVPPKVCLNEAVELAKRYGDEESSRFVNGILDTIHKTYGRRSGDSAAPTTHSTSS